MPQCPSKSSSGKARLIDYVAGRLDSSEAARLALHIRRCDTCRAVVADQSAVWNLLDDWTPHPAQPAFNHRVRARVHQAGRESLGSRFARILGSWVPRPALTIPFAAMLLLGSFYLGRPGAKIETEVAAPVTTNDAEQLKSALEDLQLLHQLDLVKDEAPDASRSM